MVEFDCLEESLFMFILVIFLNLLFLHPFVKIGEYSTLLWMASNHILFMAGLSFRGLLQDYQERILAQYLDWGIFTVL